MPHIPNVNVLGPATFFQDSWIGLSDIKHDGEWVWADDDDAKLSWNNGIWLPNHPIYNGRERADDTKQWVESYKVPDFLADFTGEVEGFTGTFLW